MSTEHKGWIGVDLDGTLAVYDGWKGQTHIGPPIRPMVQRVKAWLEEGKEVRIFTARVSDESIRDGTVSEEDVRVAIAEWCLEHLGQILLVTHEKDYRMVELWDDRAVQVVPNTGMRADTANVMRATGTESRVIADIVSRQQLGIRKYGTTVEGNPLPLKQWLQHAYEETLDQAVYLKRAIEELDMKETFENCGQH